ncbi:MMPL family transporter [Planomonospora corallina]|uniref:MMPL family transporter n=1 Tax=Planomonospora corallina TaxID=1806052 RepID=A0ABV8I9E2_9ACTN
MFESLGRIVYRGRWSILALAVVFAVLAGLFGLSLFGRMVDGGFEDPDAESTAAARWSQEWFGGSAPDVVILYTNPRLEAADDRFERDVRAALDALPAEHVAEVTTYWETGAKELVSTDGHSTYAMVSLRGDEQDKQRRYTEIRGELRQAPAGYAVRIGGAVPLLVDLNTQTAADLQQAELISMPVLLVLLVLVFGSLVAAGLPLVVGVLSVIGALALLRLLTEVTDVSVFSLNVVTMLGLGLAIDYSLFVLSAFREEIHRGAAVDAAVVRTLATAGRTVAFSGLTVATALCGLLLFPQMFLRSIGLGAAAVVLVAMAAALVVLPALLAVLGRKVDALNVMPRFGGRHGGTWHTLASSVMRRPVLYLVGVGVVLFALAAPFLHVRFGSVDHRVLPAQFESRQVAERIDRDFARNAMSPIEVTVLVERDLVGPMTAAVPGALPSEVGGRPGPVGVGNSGPIPVTEVGPLDVKVFADRLAELDHVTGVDVTGVSQAGGAVRLAVRHDGDPMSDEARALVERIRAMAPEPDFRDVVVGGATAAQLDLQASLAETLPWTALVVCLMTGLLLFAAFGSVLLPVKAILMNVMSLGASFGVIVWAFQDGHLADVLGFTPTGTIEATITVLILAVVFGLSMDYELFLLSRVRAEWLRTGDNSRAVAVGLEKTGGLITSAALLLLVVIGAFSTAGITLVKMLGVGMFVAIVVDATLVRALLVPATMRLMGDANWWIPGFLRGLHRRIEFREHDTADAYGAHGAYRPMPTYVTVEREDGPATGPAAVPRRALAARHREVPAWRRAIAPPPGRRTAPPVTLQAVREPPAVTEPPAEAPVARPPVTGSPVTGAPVVEPVAGFRAEPAAASRAGSAAGPGPSRITPAPVSTSASASAPVSTPASASAPVSTPASASAPASAAREGAPVRPGEGTPVEWQRKVVKPNPDGPGWHWADEGTAPSPPQPLLTVEDAVGPMAGPISHSPGRPPASRPVPETVTPFVPPRPGPQARPTPPTGPGGRPPVPSAMPEPTPPTGPAPSTRPESGPPVRPESGSPVRPEPAPPARSAPAISPHLIDRLEPPVRRQDSRPIVPITGRPRPVPEPGGGTEAPAPRPAPSGPPPTPYGPPPVPRSGPGNGTPPVPTSGPGNGTPSAPTSGPGNGTPSAPTSGPGNGAWPVPESVAESVPETVHRAASGRRAPQEEQTWTRERSGWMPMGRRVTRVVRPDPDGSGWTWVEVDE